VFDEIKHQFKSIDPLPFETLWIKKKKTQSWVFLLLIKKDVFLRLIWNLKS
jgi:hypothetical protein